MNMDRRGFTLMEMLVVVAIILILVAIAIPHSVAVLAKAREAVCATNRRSAATVLQSQMLLGDLDPDDLQEALDELNIKCPSGGVYYAKYDGQTQIVTVECRIHTQTITQSVLSEFTQMCQKYTDYVHYKSNDAIRQAMYEQLGGKWNTIGFEGDDTAFYIQPYWNVDSNEMYVFASTQSNANGNWFTGYIYNDATATWYHGPAFSFVGQPKCWDDVWETMQSKDWQPVKVEYETKSEP
jgi:prepilin-type N-terminal cleavage/methylation domain-containing protein